MKNTAKKLISLLLAAVMVFGVLPAIGLTATAETVMESESNDDYASADLISLNSSVVGDMYVNYDKDYYKIIPDSNGKLELTFKHNYVDNGWGWYVRVFYHCNGVYNELSYTEILMNANETIKLPSVGVVKDGVYYFEVGSICECSDPVGYDYTITNVFTSTDYYEKEINDDYGFATVIKYDNSYSGTINIGHDKDYYKIVPDSNGKLELTFKHNYVDNGWGWYVRVIFYSGGMYNELSYTEISMSSNESIKIPSVGAVQDGIYYLEVGSIYGSVEPVGYEYTITKVFTYTDYYEKETNNDYGSANVVKLNNAYSGTINITHDKDYYKIVPESNGKLELTFKHNYVDNGWGWYARIIFYSGGMYNELSYTEISMNANESINLPAVGAVKDGVYYLEIGSICESGDPVSYDYIIDNIFTPTEFYEKEFNNSFSASNVIADNTIYRANINSYDDTDYFKYYSNSNDNLKLTFSHSITNDSSSGWNIAIYKYFAGEYNEIYSTYVTESDTLESSEIFTLNTDAGTTYYIKVSIAYYPTTSEYSFILGSEPVVIPEYTLTYNANGGSGAPSVQTGKTSYFISSTVPTRNGYTFLGWSENSNATTATYSAGQTINLTKNTVLYAVWKKNETPVTPPETWYTCPYCGGKFNNYSQYDAHIKAETALPAATVDIRTPSTTTINYGDSIVLHAEVKNLPAGGYVDWYVSNGNFSTAISSDDSKLTITPYSSGETVITAVVYDADGNELDSDTQTMTSKAGFFQKIIAFFKKLFGMTKVIPQVANK